jgi:hypothetical protein
MDERADDAHDMRGGTIELLGVLDARADGPQARVRRGTLIATVVGLLGCRAEGCCMRVRALSGPWSTFWRTYVRQSGESL